jgi:LemA protein
MRTPVTSLSLDQLRGPHTGGDLPDKIAANNELSSALSRLLVVVEKYPDLKSNENFLRLQDELAGTENRVAVERRRYNDAVQSYNVAVRSFPGNIVAGMFGFEQAAFFTAQAAAQAPPQVKF